MPAPGPLPLGRSVVINAGDAIPAPWMSAPVVTVDDAALRAPAAVVERLHRGWARREPVVIELAIDPAKVREPASISDPPWSLEPTLELWADRLHFLLWANAYDARGGGLVWWWGRKATRAGATEAAAGEADVVLADGTAAWVDGGPRRPWDPGEVGGFAVVHAESVELGRAVPGRAPVAPDAELAPDQLEAVAHLSGPARVIAPAGSGKTRVLTERLRHLLGDRGWEREAVLAVAYNKEAQLELERRTSAFSPRVRTLNSLGLWVVAEHRGGAPAVLEERECRRIVERLLPGGRRPRRANTDPIGPYLEALGTIRLGLRPPSEVEALRDDVDGLGEMFVPYREALAERGAVDFDEQIYGALEALLADGAFRRRMQQRCRHLLVDEFQDLTPAHVLLLRLLALPALDVFGVGDDDQVIYGHVGADPAHLIHYAERFPEAAEHALTVNYRCPTAVVEAAVHLLGYNRRRVAKEIEPGPQADPAADALRVVAHGPDDAASTLLEVVRGWLDEPGVEPQHLAVLTRVNSLLLAPQVVLADAGIPVRSVLRPEVLERTGLRAALAYLRIATAGSAIDPRDIVEVLRRPTRGLPQWFPDRLGRRTSWSVEQVRSIADQVPDKEAAKVLRLADDLAAVQQAAQRGTTRTILEVVRDEVGLGSAMSMLDRTGAAQGSSHLDDLDGLLGVADLHPEPTGFEAWLRQVFQRETDADGVVLSTIHRVKGREWDRVCLFGVSDGVVPHRLADDLEEERRVLHVGITRGRHRVAVLADRSRPSGFLGELDGSAPRQPERRPAPARDVQPVAKGAARGAKAPADAITAERGRTLKVLGGYEGEVTEVDARGATISLTTGGALRVRFGERVDHRGKVAPLAAPLELWDEAAAAEALLRAWRTERCSADGVPAYVVLNDAHLRGIALARPSSAEELAACDGIGPTKLDRYGDDILAVLDQVPTPS